MAVCGKVNNGRLRSGARYRQVQLGTVLKRRIMWYIFKKQTLLGYQIWYWEGWLGHGDHLGTLVQPLVPPPSTTPSTTSDHYYYPYNHPFVLHASLMTFLYNSLLTQNKKNIEENEGHWTWEVLCDYITSLSAVEVETGRRSTNEDSGGGGSPFHDLYNQEQSQLLSKETVLTKKVKGL